MTDRTRIAAYLAGLVAVFTLAWTLGNITASDPGAPTPVPQAPSQHH